MPATVNFDNADRYVDTGGSSLTLGAMTLSNSGGLNIGNSIWLPARWTTLTAAGLINYQHRQPDRQRATKTRQA